MSTTAKKNGKKKKTGKEIAVIVFAIFIALSMMIPSIGYIVNYYNNQEKMEHSHPTIEQVNETFGQTIENLENRIKEDPNSYELYDQLGDAYLAWAGNSYDPNNFDGTIGRVGELSNKAIDAFDHSLDIETNERAILGKALALVLTQKPDQAKEVLETYLKNHPDSPDAYAMLAGLFEESNDTQKAIDTYQKMKDSTNDPKLKQQIDNKINKLKQEQGSKE